MNCLVKGDAALVDFSIVTIVRNNASRVQRCLDSVARQVNCNVEHVLIDGASTDGTLETLLRYEVGRNVRLLSEPDKGIYNAMNKGLALCSGRFVGFLNSDDFYADDYVLEKVSSQFASFHSNVVYGDVAFFREAPERIKRVWHAGAFSTGRLKLGWLAPHPAVFFRRADFLHIRFDESFKISGDTHFLLRIFFEPNVRVSYVRSLLVKMELGGVSTSGPSAYLRSFREDIRAYSDFNDFPVVSAAMKKLRKLNQVRI